MQLVNTFWVPSVTATACAGHRWVNKDWCWKHNVSATFSSLRFSVGNLDFFHSLCVRASFRSRFSFFRCVFFLSTADRPIIVDSFEKRVTIRDNGAQENGGAFIMSDGTVTFERPDKVNASGNYIYGGQISGGVVRIHKSQSSYRM